MQKKCTVAVPCAYCGAPLQRRAADLRRRPAYKSYCNKRCKDTASLGNKRLLRHGMSHTKEHNTWTLMRQRCSNPRNGAYARYGGRGITVCAEWDQSFEAFLRDMGPAPSPAHSIERVDNDLGYSPDNCIWATRQVQMRNRSNTRTLTYRGRTAPMTVWAEEVGVAYKTLWARINSCGWSIEKALAP